MKMLDPNNPDDRKITAFTRMYYIKDWELGTIRAGLISYDCWGNKQGGIYKFTTTPEYFAKYGGQKSYLTLKLTQRGCCPPQLMKGFIEQEGMPVDERDPIEEAMKLHKRGYFGGGS